MERKFNLTDQLSTKEERKTAWKVALFFVTLSVIITPFAVRPGPNLPAFLPMYGIFTGLADILTAYILFIQLPNYSH